MTFEKVKDLIVESLNCEEDIVTMEADLDADSLDAVELVMAVEDEFGVEVSDEEAAKLVTVGDIVRYIESHQ